MRVFRISETGDPEALLAALESGTGSALLLGPDQEAKPGGLEALGSAAEAAPLWAPSDPHPDLILDPIQAWLWEARLPPFGPERRPGPAPWQGLAGPSALLAEALRRGLRAVGPEGPWVAALAACLPAVPAVPERWLFQSRLPGPEEVLERARLRGRCWAALKRAGLDPRSGAPPAPEAEDPHAWLKAGLALAAVPAGVLARTQVSGSPAQGLVAGLARACLERSLDLALRLGYARAAAEAPPAPAAVARPLRRVAVVFPAYGGSLNLARRSAEALERLGFEVERVDPSNREAEVGRAQASGDPQAWRRLEASLETECLAALAAGRAQWVWILAQAPLSPGALAALRRRGLLTAYWFCEDHRVRPHWRALAPAVDAFFPMQGGAFTGLLRDLGRGGWPVLRGCAASEACAAAPAQIQDLPLTFFGAPYANRVRLFEALADLPLGLYGEGWDRLATPPLAPLVRDPGRLNEAQGFALFRRTAVNLNLHSSPTTLGVDPEGDYLNPRTFEIAACGAFQLCDRRRDLAGSFEEGVEMEAFSTVEELRGKIARFSGDAAARARISGAARARVLREHTYERRLDEAVRALGIIP